MAAAGREKEYDKALYGACRKAAKNHGIRFTRFFFWGIKGEFFFSSCVLALPGLNGATVTPLVKPLLADEIAWRVLHMESNLDERMSLHATGAFQGPSLYPFDGGEEENEKMIRASSELDLPELAESAAGYTVSAADHFIGSVGGSVEACFQKMVERFQSTEPSTNGFGLCVALIALGRVREARAVAAPTAARGSQRDLFTYGVGDKGDATLIVEYCDRLLAGEGEGHE